MTKTSKPRKTIATKRSVSKQSTKKAQKKGVVHHAKRLYHVTPKFIHGMVVGAFIGILVVIPLSNSGNADALTISSGKDCDGWSIINCGVQSTAELKKAYDSSGYVADVFKYFTISSNDIDTINKTAVKGTVYDNGKISVDGKTVATDAVTAARKPVTNKDKKVTYSGSTFYTRPIKTAWSHKSAPAYVVMKSGVFDYAILAPCGNPIVATAKKTTTKTTPQPATPSPTTPTKPTAPTTPDKTPPPVDTDVTPPAKIPVETTSKISTLPKTGIGSVVIIFVMAAVGGYIFHMTHHHVKKRRHHSKHHTHHRAV